MFHRRIGFLRPLGLAACAGLAARALGTITPVSEARYTRALVDTSDLLGGVNPRHDEQLHQPMHMFGWDDVAAASVPYNTVTSGDAEASQSSDISTTLLSAEGTVSTDALGQITVFSPVFSHTTAITWYSVDMVLAAGTYEWDVLNN